MEQFGGLPSKVATLVREAMAKERVSQRQLSEASGIPIATLSRRLNGHTPFDLGQLYAIARHIGFKPSQLMAVAEEMDPDVSAAMSA